MKIKKYQQGNPLLRMTTGGNKILAGFNPDGTARFAYTLHDQNPTTGSLQLPEINVTPKNGTIDELGNIHQTLGGIHYMNGKMIGEVPVSNTDPLAQFYVEGTALSEPLRLLGRRGLYVLGKYGSGKAQNWARAKLISNEMKLANPMEKMAINAIGRDGIPKTLHTNHSINFKPYNIAPEGETPSVLGPKNWLSDWTDNSGKEITLNEESLRKLFDQTKERVRQYIHGDEFKQRLVNSKQFTKKEYSDLIKVLEERLDNTVFKGTLPERGAENRAWVWDDGTIDTSMEFEVYSYPTYSPIQHRANMWHEIWHSLGGRDKDTIDPNPLIQKLQKYNESINPTNKSHAIKEFENMVANSNDPEQAIINVLRPVNPSISDRALARFARNENRIYNFLNEEVSKKEEVRSRMEATLEKFRNLGYDTKKLINNPDKFIQWVNEIKNNRIYVPYDLQHLLQRYNIRDLANYASKMLSTTGGVYLGTSQLNNNSKNNNYGKKNSIQ